MTIAVDSHEGTAREPDRSRHQRRSAHRHGSDARAEFVPAVSRCRADKDVPLDGRLRAEAVVTPRISYARWESVAYGES